MGIQNLSSFIQRYPKAIETININEYAYKIIAVDTSLYMCKFKAVAGDRWLSEFVRLVYTLRANDIHCLFIYDTKSPPEKMQEKQRRRNTREKSENKIEEIIDILDRYNISNTLEEKEKTILMDFQKQRKITTPVRLLLAQEHKEELNIRALQQEVEKIKKQHFSISPEDFEKTKKLFKILDVHYILAPMEAETTCADLCKRGIVDAVLSEDTDVLAYGCPIFLCKISTNKGVGTCTRINFKVLLEEMEFTEQQFLDFCIMCGTDYNHNIPKIGNVTAYRLIKQNGTIEDVEKSGINVSILNHIKTRSLFTDYERVEWEKQYCGIPNFNRLQKFFVVNNISIRVEEIEKHFTSSIVIEN